MRQSAAIFFGEATKHSVYSPNDTKSELNTNGPCGRFVAEWGDGEERWGGVRGCGLISRVIASSSTYASNEKALRLD